MKRHGIAVLRRANPRRRRSLVTVAVPSYHQRVVANLAPYPGSYQRRRLNVHALAHDDSPSTCMDGELDSAGPRGVGGS